MKKLLIVAAIGGVAYLAIKGKLKGVIGKAKDVVVNLKDKVTSNQ